VQQAAAVAAYNWSLLQLAMHIAGAAATSIWSLLFFDVGSIASMQIELCQLPQLSQLPIMIQHSSISELAMVIIDSVDSVLVA
jgi:hypothetical protein